MQTPGRSRKWKWLLWLLLVPALLFAAYCWFVLTWSYSRGERAGYVQKLSLRGWLCKTWEGELALVTMPGTVAEKFQFSVRSEEIARRINASLGQRVALDYSQHLGIPTSCFGETSYFVNGVRTVSEPTLLPGVTATPPAPAPADAPGATPPPAGAPK